MKKIGLYIIALTGFMFTSCEDWLDVNKNPNEATKEQVSKDLLLTGAQNLMARQKISYSSHGSLAQYVTKSGSFSGTYTFLTGLIMPQNLDEYWQNIYWYIANLKEIKLKAQEENDPGYDAIASALIVQNYQRLVDMFNNVPYTEGALGGEVKTPKYDKGSDIYASLISECDAAVANIDKAIADPGYSTTALQKSDIYCHGDLQQWRRFIRTIQLGLLMRISNVQDVSAQVAAIQNECLDINEHVTSNPGYYKETYKMNHLYETWGYNYLNAIKSLNREYRPTTAVVDMLRENNDPRLRVYVAPRTYLGNPSDGTADYEKYGLADEYYIGVPYGQMSPPTYPYESGIGMGILAGSSSFTTGPLQDSYIKCGAEVGFFLAEAALRGMIGGGDAAAKDYYEKAVISTFKRYEVALKDTEYEAVGTAPAIEGSAEDAARAYLSQQNAKINWDLMTTNEQKIEAIFTQKWLSLYMIDFSEGWSELRRGDYPRLGRSVSGNSNKLLARMPYPQTERNLNMDNVSKEGEINYYESLVFWDLKNEIAPETQEYL